MMMIGDKVYATDLDFGGDGDVMMAVYNNYTDDDGNKVNGNYGDDQYDIENNDNDGGDGDDNGYKDDRKN